VLKDRVDLSMKSETNLAVPFVPMSAPFNDRQRAWLNGYLAGLTSFTGTDTGGTVTPSAPTKAKVALTILFGSQSGTAEGLAKKLAKESAQYGFAASIKEANACSLDELAKAERLLLLTSTWGEGDAPDNAAQLLAALTATNAPRLEKLLFSVLALGDKNYSDFCGAGRKFDEALEKLGAKRIHPRVDCDLDYEVPAKAWVEAVWKALSPVESRESKVEGTAVTQPTNHEPRTTSAAHSRNNPFPARLLVNRKLNGEDSAKDTRHISISLEDSGLTYEVGDALGVFPMNCPALVADILSALGCDGEEAVKSQDGSEISLRHALLRHYQVTQPGSSLLQAVAERAQSAELKTLLAPENKVALEKHLHGREVIDLLCEHPLARFTPEEFVTLLRKLNPRLYSIASSLKAHAGEVHLCVGTVRYETLGRSRKGVCSTFLADRVDESTRVPVFVQTSHGFRPPTDSEKPMIMVGPGTGIAPFRAFLEERKAIGARGKNWLFFGDQKRSCDFLYRDELEALFKEGTLTRLDTAFSRDQAEKVYVQTRMLEHATELFAWLEEGAHFYVCGDAKRMAKDVDAALHEVIRTAGGKSGEAAAEYVAQLKSAKRYQRDVY
jgi:sulfite reductase (NADPH) flavoprotein alpha-component